MPNGLSKNRRLALAVILIIAAAASCRQETPEPPVIVLGQETVEFTDAGGTGKVTYEILNAAEDGTYEIMLEGLPEWITEPVTSVPGEISFTVAENTGDAREALLTVTCEGSSAQFTVKQEEMKAYLTAEELSGCTITTQECLYFEEETRMYKYNYEEATAEKDENGNYVYMTAGAWAQDYIDKYLSDYPGSSATVDELMYFDFTDRSGGSENYLYVKTTTDNMMECWYGSRNDSGDMSIRRMYGKYTYDESTGTMTVEDVGNSTYTRTVVFKIVKTSPDMCEYEITDIVFPYQPWVEGDSLPFFHPDYDNPDNFGWQPCGKLLYKCVISRNE